MLAADGADHPVGDEISSQRRERPASVGQPDGARRLLGKAEARRARGGIDAARRPARLPGSEAREPLLPEGVEVGVDRIRVRAERRGDVPRLEPGGVEHDGLRAATLPSAEVPLQQLMEVLERTARGPADGQRARHG